MSSIRSIKRLSKFLLKYRKEVILGPLCKLTEAIIELIIPLIMSNVIDYGVKSKDVSHVMKMGGIMVLFSIVGLTFALICQYYASKASQGFGTDLRSELFSHVNNFSFQQLDRFAPHVVTTRMTNDINQLQNAVALGIRLLTRAPFLIIGAIFMSLMINVRVSCIVFAVSVLIGASIFIIMRKVFPLFKTIQSKLEDLSLMSRETLKGNKVIRAFSKQEDVKNNFRSSTDSLLNTLILTSKVSSFLNPVTYVIINFAIVAVIWIGGIQVNNEQMSQGDIVAVVNYMTQILLSLIVLANLIVVLIKANASAVRVAEILEERPAECKSGQFTGNLNDTDIKISFENVCFSYDEGGNWDVRNISFSLQKGKTLGIIGATGSGKSTIINLLARFYNVSSGRILLDGVDIKNYPISTLREKIGVVMQKTVLFDGTIKSNLCFGKELPTEEEILEALEISQAMDFVSKLPDGYMSKVEAGGKNFSGGQRQRLSIARTIIMDPEILVLDDSSSALDLRTDFNLRVAIQRWSKEKSKTVIIISQRTESIKSADKIIVMDEGKMVGIGTHDELLERCKVYKEIESSQSS